MARVSSPASDGAFGSGLKTAREAHGITLRQIADRTKLSMGALEALERDDISKLPGGIFSRAFVRAYAGEVGLDPEQTVRAFIEQHPHDWVTAGSPMVSRHEDDDAPDMGRRRRVTLAVIVIIVVAALAGLLLVWSARAGGAGATGAGATVDVRSAPAAQPQP
jgi:cytoskeleton protein RodZ